MLIYGPLSKWGEDFTIFHHLSGIFGMLVATCFDSQPAQAPASSTSLIMDFVSRDHDLNSIEFWMGKVNMEPERVRPKKTTTAATWGVPSMVYLGWAPKHGHSDGELGRWTHASVLDTIHHYEWND